ncbi:exosortase/archaeosortase family protein [Hyperthermus butylicus]|uniref:Exosortase/archaeosortase family protein n=1 Tax=Hyperthermus butylicus (strain DSM 5456 / JCM 9403 / PLM1-5) TaxID=415426 RepID=A2BLZ3_HYPBU|nr:exosortase/archaeosortase family protein [Hyperthermus butylicus]ABM81004.1 hypothetical protein Hbut_1169 [Hyperthermus butylicus DSM 5456]
MIRKARTNSFYSLLVSIAVITVILYVIIFTSLYKPVVLIEKRVMILSYKALGINVIDVAHNALMIWGGGNVVTIVLTPSCVGIYSLIVYILLVVFTPRISKWQKVKAGIVGSTILFFANIVRMFVSGVAGVVQGYAAFRFFHDVLGGAFMILLVATLWVDWIYRTSRYAGWP